MNGDTRRISALDGLRGIAILLVIIGHATTTAIGPQTGWLLPIADAGRLGVTLFFVLSGYLITSIIAGERERRGTVSLRRFYARRALRILPAYYVFVGTVALLALLGVVGVRGDQVAAAALFVWNYYPGNDNNWWLGHTWSLAVEEQFYLLWPLVLIALKPRRAVQLAVVVMLLGPAARVATYLWFPPYQGSTSILFHTRADSLLVGCALALLPIAYPGAWDWLTSVARRVPLEVAALLTFVASGAGQVIFGGKWMIVAGYSVCNVATATLLLVLIARPTGVLGRGLGARPLVLLGLISYSLYLWQQLFLTELDTSVLGMLPVSIGAAVALATASYLLVERPFLRAKRRYETPTPALVALAEKDSEPAI